MVIHSANSKAGSLIRSRKPDLVHLHGQFAGSLGQFALQLATRPLSVYTVQWPAYLDDGGPWSRLRNYAAERVSCGLCSAVVAVSEYDRRELLGRGLCSATKLTVIHNAYSLDDEVIQMSSTALEAVVGFVGRLVDQKGCEYLLRAAPIVIAAHPSVRFIIVGDGPELGRLTELARQLGLNTAVEFVGYDPAPGQRMKAMSVLAIPSIYEPLGMVALEAMACSVPVVASAVGGLSEAIDDGRTGILVPPRDPDAIARALIRLLEKPEERAEMGLAAHARALSEFSPETITSHYQVLYERLLAARSS